MTVLRTSYEPEAGTTIAVSITPSQRAEIAEHLGYRASDLLQSNSIVWVEGPSDRVYLNHWIRAVDSSLVEGIHYSIMFYGGRLLARLTGEEMETLESRAQEFIHLLRINRHMAIVIDSDKRGGNSKINETKQRILTEFRDAGGYSWLTAGREIENYVPPEVLADAIGAVHPRKGAVAEVPAGRYDDAFHDLDAPDKVGIAERAVMDEGLWQRLDLEHQVAGLVAFIHASNNEAVSFAREVIDGVVELEEQVPDEG